MKVPHLYKKLAELIRNDNNGSMKLPEFQDRLTKFRIEKREALEIAKELERRGIVVLDIKKGVNQHFKIRVTSKGTATFYMASAVILLYCMLLLSYSLAVMI